MRIFARLPMPEKQESYRIAIELSVSQAVSTAGIRLRLPQHSSVPSPMIPIEHYRDRLKSEGWNESSDEFWKDENPCFYDLTLTKTVLIFRNEHGQSSPQTFFWKFESQELPDFMDPEHAEVRRYKLHHSMNALLWHDYGNRKIVH
jgi:hypothetical protein